MNSTNFVSALQILNPVSSPFSFSSNTAFPIKSVHDHIQGIQKLQTPNGEYFVLSCSNTPDGLVIFVNAATQAVENYIPFSGSGHAGGIQVHGATLAVPLAAGPGPSKSSTKYLRFYDISDPGNPRLINSLELPDFPDAQAAGFTEVDDEHHLAVVVVSAHELRFGWLDTQFVLIEGTSWQKLDVSSLQLDIDYLWPQNVNLFTENGTIYFTGLLSDKGNLIECFELEGALGENVTLKGGFLKLLQGNVMRAAGGISYSSDGDLSALAYHRTIEKTTSDSNVIDLYSGSAPIDSLVQWGDVHQVAIQTSVVEGQNMVIAMADDNIVMSNYRSPSGDALCAMAGTLDMQTNQITWGVSCQFGQNTSYQNLASGVVDGQAVFVNVHELSSGNELSFCLGKMIDAPGHELLSSWGAKQDYTTGSVPTIACYEDAFVEVHRGSGSNDQLYYGFGTLNPADNKLNFKTSKFEAFDQGNYPSVALYGNVCVEIHSGSSKSHEHKLYYRVGIVGEDTIEWSDKTPYFDTGSPVHVAFYGQGSHVIVVHRGSNSDKLYYRTGAVNALQKSIEWFPAGGSLSLHDTGHEVAVATLGADVIQVHKSSDSDTYNLYAQVGEVV